MTELSCENFFANLLERIPSFMDIYREHFDDNNGELLPHLLMGDFARFVVQKGRPDESASEVVKESMLLIEDACRFGDDNLREVVCASFLENLDQDDIGFAIVAQFMNEMTRREFTKFDWYPKS